MPSLPNREILRAILSNPTAVRAERHRRRVRSGTDRDLLAFVEETFGVHIPAVACCPEHVAPAQAFCDAYFNRADVACVESVARLRRQVHAAPRSWP